MYNVYILAINKFNDETKTSTTYQRNISICDKTKKISCTISVTDFVSYIDAYCVLTTIVS